MVPVFFSSSTVSKDNYFLVEKKNYRYSYMETFLEIFVLLKRTGLL